MPKYVCERCGCYSVEHRRFETERDEARERIAELERVANAHFADLAAEREARSRLEAEAGAMRHTMEALLSRVNARIANPSTHFTPSDGFIIERALSSTAGTALLDRLAKAEAIAELDDIRRKRELTPSEADQLVEARAAWRAAREKEGR